MGCRAGISMEMKMQAASGQGSAGCSEAVAKTCVAGTLEEGTTCPVLGLALGWLKQRDMRSLKLICVLVVLSSS